MATVYDPREEEDNSNSPVKVVYQARESDKYFAITIKDSNGYNILKDNPKGGLVPIDYYIKDKQIYVVQDAKDKGKEATEDELQKEFGSTDFEDILPTILEQGRLVQELDNKGEHVDMFAIMNSFSKDLVVV